MINLEALDKINWNFNGAHTNYSVHSFHWYLGTFVPQIPSILITNFTDNEEKVLDPFCGCGTTLVEAMRLRRYSIGVDMNSLACLISKVKTTVIEKNTLDLKVQEILKKIDNDFQILDNKFCDEHITPDLRHLKDKINKHIPNFPDKENWFHIKTLWELGLIKMHIDNIEDKDFKDFCFVAFSDRLKYLSLHRKTNYGYIADNCVKNKHGTHKLEYVGAVKEFKRKLKLMADDMNKFYADSINNNEEITLLNKYCKVHQGDCGNLQFLDDNSIDLVVTSPPYPTTIDYTTGHRLSFYWLGYDINDINQMKKNEMGARCKRFTKERALNDYCKEMEIALSEIHRVMKKDSYFCLVFGEIGKKLNGETVEEKIMEICTQNIKFKLHKTIPRTLTKQRLAARSVEKECIHILQKK